MNEVKSESTEETPASAKKRRHSRGKNLGSQRHLARTLAMQVLYETDLTQHSWEEVLDRVSEDQAESTVTKDYLQQLVAGIEANLRPIDDIIAKVAPEYPVDQIAPVDRSILRVAVWELRPESDVPTKAAINEAIELAKHFGGDHSGRFVNGALGAAAILLRPEAAETAEER